jgi:3,4-dihydroxyphenylacetate 2,3-dioxygenase
VAEESDLRRAEQLAQQDGLAHGWLAEGEERGQGRALRLQDPAGLPLEFFHSMHEAPRLLQRYDLHRGPGVLRLDHFNCQVPEVEELTRWYSRQLGFRISELTETSTQPAQLWAVWLHRKQTVHDLALMMGRGPRVHHAGFAVPDAMAVLRACDVLAGAGRQQAIERGPGRHGLSNALFVYLRDPDGNRIELYTGDYLTADTDAPPLRWSLEDPRRATFWGDAAPASWFDDASPVLSVLDGQPVPQTPPTLKDRPNTVT